MARGILETEVRRDPRGATILLTLLRCVGWLSRGDLRMRRGDAGPEMETPDAQEIGPHRFEFAFAGWRGPHSDADWFSAARAMRFRPGCSRRARASTARRFGYPSATIRQSCSRPRGSRIAAGAISCAFSTRLIRPRRHACASAPDGGRDRSIWPGVRSRMRSSSGAATVPWRTACGHFKLLRSKCTAQMAEPVSTGAWSLAR